MSMAYLTSLVEWLGAHPVLSALLVFIIALSESLAIVGLILPGIFFMVIFGALITTGYFAYWPTVIAAILGAIAGDGISYWLGWKYQAQLSRLWPFRNHPQIMQRGVQFFERHGGKSVLLGRFVGPLRPIIPAVAGMLDMPLNKFIVTNVGSALLWGPIVLLPGMAFGLSLEVASEFAGRFSLLLIVLLFLLWLVYWIVKQLYFFMAPRTDVLLSRIINWSGRHPRAGRLSGALLDPAHSEARILTLLAFTLLFASVLFVTVTQFLGQQSILTGLNELVFHQLQGLHTPPFDVISQALSHLGDSMLLGAITLVFMIAFALYHNWLAVWHLVAAYLLPIILVHTLKVLFAFPLPEVALTNSGLSLPVGHMSIATAVYGLLAIIITRELPVRFRSGFYVLAASLILLIGFARLYLGIHSLGDVVASIMLGIIWLTLLGIGYRRHVHLPLLPVRQMAYPALLTLFLLFGYPLGQSYSAAPPVLSTEQYRIGWQAWLETGWQMLPQYRFDLRHQNHFPMNLQWAAHRQQIESTLRAQGWQVSEFAMTQSTQWLNPNATLQKLPVVPHLHEGRYEDIRYIRYDDRQQRILVLRLWSSAMFVQKNTHADLPVWLGTVTYLEIAENAMIRYLKTSSQMQEALQAFKNSLPPGLTLQQVNSGAQNILLITSFDSD